MSFSRLKPGPAPDVKGACAFAWPPAPFCCSSFTLVVNKDGSWAERFELKGTQSIRPIPGVNIREFKVVMTFWRDTQSGEVLFETMESRIRGRAFGIKSLDNDRQVRFTDFRGPEATSDHPCA